MAIMYNYYYSSLQLYKHCPQTLHGSVKGLISIVNGFTEGRGLPKTSLSPFYQ